MADSQNTPGVYFLEEGGERRLVHVYTDDDYVLADIAELFLLGQVGRDAENAESTFSLGRAELRTLKVHADAESFDHPPGFIEMCLDIYRFGENTPEDPLIFISIE